MRKYARSRRELAKAARQAKICTPPGRPLVAKICKTCDKYRTRFTIDQNPILIAPSSAFARNFGTPSFVPMPATHNNRTCRPPPARWAQATLGVRRVMRAEHLMTVGGEPNPANRQVLPTMRVSQFTRLSGQAQRDWVTATVNAAVELPTKPAEADIRHYMGAAPSCKLPTRVSRSPRHQLTTPPMHLLSNELNN